MPIKTQALSARTRRLRTSLEAWRRQLGDHVHDRIRDLRGSVTADREVFDAAETSELGIQDDIELGVIQIKAETLSQVNAALRRIDEGRYGRCLECECDIAEARLRALPFAIRCRSCEDARESADERERTIVERIGSSAVFQDITE